MIDFYSMLSGTPYIEEYRWLATANDYITHLELMTLEVRELLHSSGLQWISEADLLCSEMTLIDIY